MTSFKTSASTTPMTSSQALPLVDRVLLIILDGVGCGAAPDADLFGDLGANSLAHVAATQSSWLRLPHLTRWGLGNLTPMGDVAPPLPLDNCVASFGRIAEISSGKDTTSGHWEMVGSPVLKPFATFPQGFASEVVERWCREHGLPGVLGNLPASGTEIIEKWGEEHIRTGKPILYTSADSVWQVATHEQHFGLERLYEICKGARKICDELQVSRVIARPFLGETASTFKRTSHRKDFSQTPPEKTAMEWIYEGGGVPTIGIGKIWNIFNGRGVTISRETGENALGLAETLRCLDEFKKGFLFINLIDFDMNYGHRRDAKGYGQALAEFDVFLPSLEAKLTERDLVLISSDHGNDPTYRGTDHTREYIPLLAFQKGSRPRHLGDRTSLTDIGQTIVHAFTGRMPLRWGESFWPL